MAQLKYARGPIKLTVCSGVPEPWSNTFLVLSELTLQHPDVSRTLLTSLGLHNVAELSETIASPSFPTIRAVFILATFSSAVS
jgi:hypothetical protein